MKRAAAFRRDAAFRLAVAVVALHRPDVEVRTRTGDVVPNAAADAKAAANAEARADDAPAPIEAAFKRGVAAINSDTRQGVEAHQLAIVE